MSIWQSQIFSLCEDAIIKSDSTINGNISDEDNDETLDLLQPAIMTTTGDIAAVININNYSTCISCKGSVLPTSKTIGTCSKCGASVKLTKCIGSKSAKILLSNSFGKTWSLTAYNDHIDSLIKGEDGMTIEEKLFNVSEVTIQYYTANNIIKAVRKSQ